MKFAFYQRIILIAYKYLTVLLRNQILIFAIAPLLFITVSILYDFFMLKDVYISLSPQKGEVHLNLDCVNLVYKEFRIKLYKNIRIKFI